MDDAPLQPAADDAHRSRAPRRPLAAGLAARRPAFAGGRLPRAGPRRDGAGLRLAFRDGLSAPRASARFSNALADVGGRARAAPLGKNSGDARRCLSALGAPLARAIAARALGGARRAPPASRRSARPRSSRPLRSLVAPRSMRLRGPVAPARSRRAARKHACACAAAARAPAPPRAAPRASRPPRSRLSRSAAGRGSPRLSAAGGGGGRDRRRAGQN